MALETLGTLIDEVMANPKSLFVDLCKGQGLSDLQIKTTLYYFLSASVTTYLLWHLGQNSELQRKIVDEGKRYPQKTLSQTLAEAFRLFPPVYVMSRDLKEDTNTTVYRNEEVIQTEVIDKNERLMISPALAGMDPQQFHEPSKFNPSRFDGKRLEYSWLPFGEGGYHACPAKGFSHQIMGNLISQLLSKYEITSFGKEPGNGAILIFN